MREPRAARPVMPGYGIAGPDEGMGLLPWSWARERLLTSRNYWLATAWPDGRPHVMPVWGVWADESFWFSSGARARKIRNLRLDPRCVITAEDAEKPVVVEGTAEVVTDPDSLARFIAWLNAKYATDYATDFTDPAVNATVNVRPAWAFGLDDDHFESSPTRWTF